MMTENLRFVSAGLFVAPDESWIHPMRSIDTTELILMQKGTAYLEEEGVQYMLRAGDFLRLEPRRTHRGTRRSDEPVSFYWLHFSGQLPEDSFQKNFTPAESYRLELLCRQILHYANTPGYPSEAADCLIRLIVMELAAQSQSPADGSRLISEISEWIRVNADKPVKSSEVAARFGYNEDYLSRLFRKKYGLGLKQVISEAKIRRIKTLLLSSDYTLQEIAALTGFVDYKYFLKFFHYHEGFTPTEFRSIYFNTHTNNR